MEDGKYIILKPEWLVFLLALFLFGVLTFPAGVAIWWTGGVVVLGTFL